MKLKLHLAAFTAAGLGAAAVLCLGACGRQAATDADNLSFKRVNTGVVYRLVGSAKDYDTSSDLSFECKADLLMPVAIYGHDVSALRDSIMKFAFDTVAPDHSVAIKDIFRHNVSSLGYAVADTAVADSSYDGLCCVTGSVESLTAKVLSYGVTASSYIPRAAHGMYTTFYINYDAVSGKVFTVGDLFTKEGLEKLPETLKSAAADMRGFIGPTEIDGIPHGGNFCISADGDIVFVYQPYEVASYAQGEIRIPIAPYVLSSYLTEYGTRILLGAD